MCAWICGYARGRVEVYTSSKIFSWLGVRAGVILGFEYLFGLTSGCYSNLSDTAFVRHLIFSLRCGWVGVNNLNHSVSGEV